MKTLIAAVVLAATLTTPALAEKTPVKPQDVNPTDSCASEVTFAMIMYHLDKIESALAGIETGVKPKPVRNDK